MRILFVHSIAKHKFGGGERWIVKAAAGLKEKGHEVIVAVRSHSVLYDEVAKTGVKTVHFNARSIFTVWKAVWLAAFLRRHKTDVIICKSHELTVCGLAARWAGRPVVIRRAGSPPHRLSRKLVLRTRWFVDGVVTNTHTIKEIYAQLGLDKDGLVRVIYNGLQVEDEVQAYNFSAKWPGRIVVLCVGRVVGHKGYSFLIDALPELKKLYPNLFVYVLGDGKDKVLFEQYASSKGVGHMIHFAGYIHQPAPYFKGCDLFLHPSLYEGMPNAAMEAMAYGKPVVMTRVNGAEELSDKGRYAILIPHSSAEAIVKGIAQVLENREASRQMALQASHYVRKQFSMRRMVDALEEFILQRIRYKHNGSTFSQQQ